MYNALLSFICLFIYLPSIFPVLFCLVAFGAICLWFCVCACAHLKQEELTLAPFRLKCTSTAEASWISLPSKTPQPASTTATRLAML